MDVEEADRAAKPVASRPTFYGFKSFSELLAGAIKAAPQNTRPDNAVAAIRPKTVRFKSTINHEQAGVSSSQTNILCTENDCSSAKASDCKPVVVYKPLATFVSKATVSLLANMGNFNTHSQRPPPPVDEAHLQRHEQNNHDFKSQSNPNDQQYIQVQAQKEQPMETSKISLKFGSDRPSYDGYNWRKYGQKQVKGSEYPRSYYKCTHPNCPVKKKVERSLDGQIAEIVYKGEHSHSKPQPQPPKRNSLGTQGTGFVAEGAAPVTSAPQWNTNTNESVQGRLENQSESALANIALNQVEGTPDHSCGRSRECEEGSKGLGIDEHETGNKKRKVETQSSVLPFEGVQEPLVVVQNSTDSEIISDGFRWRKYGQKVVKGNPHPRSYYRCTSLRCNVRKHVERALDNPRTFITTYEGKHNHEMPPRNKNAVAHE